jgi:alkylglycerol monooxygenase
MNTETLVLATPFFFLAILIDWLICQHKGILAYGLMALVADLSNGVGQQALALSTTALGIWMYTHAAAIAPLHLSSQSVWAWLLLIFLDDLAFYWFHRASHRINILWASHAVHHQSEDYNLAVALRQSWFAPLFGWIFFLPISLLGFPFDMVVTIRTLNTLYQFGLHTRAVGKLGWAEWLFNTPSHHRAHHGMNKEYLDSNYGGLLIIWDRLFGTFVPEVIEPLYGTTKPLNSWSALTANLAEWWRLLDLSRQARSWRDRALVWFGPPEWLPQGQLDKSSRWDRARERHLMPRTPKTYGYIVLSLVVHIVILDVLLFFHQQLPDVVFACGIAQVLCALAMLGELADGKRWAAQLEAVRVVVLIGMYLLWHFAAE